MDFHNIGESGIDVAWEEMETEMSLLIEMTGKEGREVVSSKRD